MSQPMVVHIQFIMLLLLPVTRSRLTIGMDFYNSKCACSNLSRTSRPDFTNTEPAANIGPFPQWADKKKIVSMDPLGHLAPWLFKDTIEKENGGFDRVVRCRLSTVILTSFSGYQTNHCNYSSSYEGKFYRLQRFMIWHILLLVLSSFEAT
jgi:hypothetical protein